MSIRAICTTSDPVFREHAVCSAGALGIALTCADSVSELESRLAENAPDIVLCDAAGLGTEFVTMPGRHPRMAWIARIGARTGWPAACELCRSYGFWEVIPSGECASNVFESFREAAEHGPFSADPVPMGSSACHAQRCWFLSAQSGSVRRKPFDVEHSSQGYLSQTHFFEIFYKISKFRASGMLHLCRPGMHWVLTMNGGYPLAMDTRDSSCVFGFEMWYKRHVDDADADRFLPVSASSGSENADIPQTHRLFERRRSWLAALIAEIFTWPDADFLWIPGTEKNLTAEDPIFSTHDIEEILKNAAFSHISDAKILEATQSCLSYFLKLKDNAGGLFQSGLPQKAEIVADKLRNGSPLNEMLAILPHEYPVQRVVYLAVMMDELERIS